MFQVFDENKPADAVNCGLKEGNGWDNSKFDTWEEVVDYADRWLGVFGPGKYEVNKPFYYFGPGSDEEFIIIKRI